MVITISTTTRSRTSRTGSLTLNSPNSPTAPTVNLFPRAGPLQDNSISQSAPTTNPSLSTFAPSEDDHSFSPLPGASRSPCPALNALANHGYLPRDGHGITFRKIVDSLEKGFGLSHGFAIFMAIGTFTLLRRLSLKPFDLAGANLHGFIEHNASLSRDDCPDGWQFGHHELNLDRLQEFLDKAHPTASSNGEDVFTSNDIAAHRLELEKKAPLHGLYGEIARAEFAMAMEIFGHGKDREVTEKDIETFLKEERFPDGWKPSRTIHLHDVAARSKEIRLTMATMQKAMEQSQTPAKHDDGVVTHIIDQLMKLVARREEH